MLHQPSYTCTIPYFVFFSKEEMCLDAIFRYFFSFFVIFTLFWPLNVQGSDPAEALFFKHVPIKSQNDLKELAKLPKLFLESPLQIYVYYYLGINEMALGNYFNAIHYFSKSESFFYLFNEKKRIDKQILPHYQHIVIQSLSNKAESFLELGTKAESMQKQYFFAQAAHAIHALESLNLQKDDKNSYYFLNERHRLLSKGQVDYEHFLNLAIIKKNLNNPFLAKLYYDLGAHYFHEGNAKQALVFFRAAELEAEARNDEDQLDLWVQQSICLRQLGEEKEALMTLAKVINSPTASSLRLRAMCMRASIYEEQGRHELAKKQWESIANKSGRWAKLAKQKL